MAPRARCALPVVVSAATDIEVKPAKSSLQNTGLRSPSLPRLRANSNSELGATRSPAFRPRSSRLTWNGQAVRPFPPSCPSALACCVQAPCRLPADDGFAKTITPPSAHPLCVQALAFPRGSLPPGAGPDITSVGKPAAQAPPPAFTAGRLRPSMASVPAAAPPLAGPVKVVQGQAPLGTRTGRPRGPCLSSAGFQVAGPEPTSNSALRRASQVVVAVAP